MGGPMAKATIVVRAEWDADAGVWVATSEDVPGLATEAELREELECSFRSMIPDRMEADPRLAEGFLPEIPVIILSEQVIRVRIAA